MDASKRIIRAVDYHGVLNDLANTCQIISVPLGIWAAIYASRFQKKINSHPGEKSRRVASTLSFRGDLNAVLVQKKI